MAESTSPADSSPPPPPPPPINATTPINTVSSKNPPTNPSLSLTFSHTISKKLDTRNYLLWCQQVEPVIKGHRHSYFHSHMNAKACQLHNELRNTNLENQTISDYVLRIQTLVDALTAIGDSVSAKEHLDIILEGLPEEYESTMSLISSRFDMLSIDEVKTLLLGHESRLDKFKKKAVASVNVTTTNLEPNSSLSHPQTNLPHQEPPPQFAQRRGGRTNFCGGCFPNRAGRGRGRFTGFQCQVCHRYGHVASSCYYRFDETFVPSSPLNAPMFPSTNHNADAGSWYNNQTAPAQYFPPPSQQHAHPPPQNSWT
uniref:Retrovirus-related Pol polyprotein from transposon TNT 1-94 n=1 Tax=Cajanus cajan TaxID=3821 RepID=A0A151RYP9_CAJCA|nr:hypothetical protein KK1_030633 [Cajanus cajan]